MSNYRISDLTNYTNPDPANDVIEIVDNTNNANKKITRNNLLGLTSAPVSINDIQTLTQKTLTAPTISSPILSGTITGTYTLAGSPTFPSSVATLTGSQTLTNKVLTSPTINAPTITNASITADALTGFSSANTGTIYGIAVTSSTIGASALASGAVTATKIGTDSSFAWTSWTPTLTNLTLGNGTNVGAYSQVGKTVRFRWIFTLGSTSAIGTGPTISLPVTSVATPNPLFSLGMCIYDNNGGSGFNGFFAWNSTTTAKIFSLDTSNNFGQVSATNPTAYGAGFKLYGEGFYEAA